VQIERSTRGIRRAAVDPLVGVPASTQLGHVAL
jgi:hypothetical protein